MSDSSPRLLVVMGSGETTPTMVSTHRRVLQALGRAPDAVLLDTPYGFQENADEVTGKALDYFASSVGSPVEVVSLRRADALSPVRLETAVARVREADWVFAGPGSPTYLAAQWHQTPLPEVVAERLRTGGATVFASAAAVTLGAITVPVYEIYKAGMDPFWAPGLDLLRAVGLEAVCVPHFDNADGGTAFDTRFCYLGERRLAALESELPAGTWVLGVDEHTALTLDLGAGTARVDGRGAVTVRARGASTAFPTGSEVAIADLVAAASGRAPGGGRTRVARGRSTSGSVAPSTPDREGTTPAEPVPAGLAEATARSAAAFDAALSGGRAVDAAEATVALEQAVRDWASDVEQADTADRARAELRRQVVALARVAQLGLHEHRDLVSPHVEALLALRQRARADGRYADADAIRDVLVDAGVEVRDTPEGADWTYHDPLDAAIGGA